MLNIELLTKVINPYYSAKLSILIQKFDANYNPIVGKQISSNPNNLASTRQGKIEMDGKS